MNQSPIIRLNTSEETGPGKDLALELTKSGFLLQPSPCDTERYPPGCDLLEQRRLPRVKSEYSHIQEEPESESPRLLASLDHYSLPDWHLCTRFRGSEA